MDILRPLGRVFPRGILFLVIPLESASLMGLVLGEKEPCLDIFVEMEVQASDLPVLADGIGAYVTKNETDATKFYTLILSQFLSMSIQLEKYAS